MIIQNRILMTPLHIPSQQIVINKIPFSALIQSNFVRAVVPISTPLLSCLSPSKIVLHIFLVAEAYNEINSRGHYYRSKKVG